MAGFPMFPKKRWVLFRCNGNDRNIFSCFLAELDCPIRKSKERVVSAAADILAGMDSGSALTHDNASGRYKLPAECLDAKHLRLAVAAVPAARLTFLMCHFCYSFTI